MSKAEQSVGRSRGLPWWEDHTMCHLRELLAVSACAGTDHSDLGRDGNTQHSHSTPEVCRIRTACASLFLNLAHLNKAVAGLTLLCREPMTNSNASSPTTLELSQN